MNAACNLWTVYHGMAEQLGCQTVTYMPGVQSSGVTLATQHMSGTALEVTRGESSLLVPVDDDNVLFWLQLMMTMFSFGSGS